MRARLASSVTTVFLQRNLLVNDKTSPMSSCFHVILSATAARVGFGSKAPSSSRPTSFSRIKKACWECQGWAGWAGVGAGAGVLPRMGRRGVMKGWGLWPVGWREGGPGRATHCWV